MLPEGNYVYEDLSSEFVELDKLVGELIQDEVTGYLKFDGGDTTGFALIERGEPRKIKVEDGDGGHIKEGRSGLAEILQDGNYMIDIVECSEAGRQIVEIKIENEEVQTDISSEDIDLPDFLATNITDQKNDCHIIMVAGQDTGVITMLDGLPSEAKFNRPGEILIGNEALEKIIKYIEEEDDAHLDIYRVPEDAQVEEEMADQIEGELQGISETFEDKADDLLDEMGLGFGDDNGGDLEDELGDFEDEADDLLDDMGIETEEN